MAQSRVATRYATALFQEAQHTDALETVMGDVRGLKTMLNDSRDFALFVASPVIKAAQKQTALKALSAKTGFAPITNNFLALLIEKSRIAELSDILDSFEALYNNVNNLLPVEITSAIELDTVQKESLLKKIAAQTNKKPQPTYAVNPALIGGFTVKIGDSMMDSSIKHQLSLLKKRLLEGALN